MDKKVVCLVVMLILAVCLAAQWTDLNLNLQGCWGTDVQAVDYDLDGDLDIYIAGSNLSSGNGITRLYRNNGNNSYTSMNIGITGYYRGCSAWADFNNDGYMDVVTTGRNNNNDLPFAKLYQGTSEGEFVSIAVDWVGLYYAWVDCGDYDNDGLIDVLMTGTDNTEVHTKLYHNEGQMVFTEMDSGLQDVGYGQCYFVDFDNDGDLDISLNGSGNNLLYRNDDLRLFVDTHANLNPVRFSGSAWGDFDNDGYPDLLTSGDGQDGPRTDLYHNLGDGSFSMVPVFIPGTLASSLFWGDYDNDGLLDILFVGSEWHFGTRYMDVYRNMGNRTFEMQEDTFISLSSGRSIFADLDNDGKLDIISAGYTGETYLAKVYRNLTPVANTPPAPPNVGYDTDNHTLTFWGANDTTTPVNGLTYNIRVGTSPGSDDVISVLENQNGYRRTVARGRRAYKCLLMAGTDYYVSAQAIDYSYAGSVFGTEAIINVDSHPQIDYAGPDILDFGIVQITETPQTRFLIISNPGNAVLSVSNLILSQTETNYVLHTVNLPYTINPGSTFSMGLDYLPVTQGVHNASLSIESNAVNEPELIIALTGVGFIPAQPNPVEDIQLEIQNNNLILSWSPTVTDVNGFPVDIDGYLVLKNYDPVDNQYYYQCFTSQTSVTLNGIEPEHRMVFYIVKAVRIEDNVIYYRSLSK
jgi:hypothetical protein